MICMGFSNKVEKDRCIVVLDMDNCSLKAAKNVACRLILRWQLGDFYIIRSSKRSYHLICLDIIRYHTFKRMIAEFADADWIKYRSKTQDFVLRISKKKTMPIMVLQVQGLGRRHKSNAHRLLLQAVYGINIKNTPLFTKRTSTIQLHVYETGTNLKAGREANGRRHKMAQGQPKRIRASPAQVQARR